MASGGAPGVVAGAGSLLMSSFSSFPGLKYGTFFGGTSTLSPVFGFRPLRGSRFRRRKLPKPRSSIFSPRCSASMMLLNTVSTITSECFLVRSETRDTSSTSSAFVMLPPVVMVILVGIGIGDQGFGWVRVVPIPIPPNPCSLFSAIPEVISQRCGAVACAFLILLPVGAELVRLERSDLEADLPLLGRQLDDLHRVGFTDLEIDFLLGRLSFPGV